MVTLGFEHLSLPPVRAKQWRIHDFQDGRQVRGKNLLFGKIFVENCMRIEKKMDREGTRIIDVPLDLPMQKVQINSFACGRV